MGQGLHARRHALTSTMVDSAGETEIRRRIDELVGAIRAMDLDRVMSVCVGIKCVDPNTDIHTGCARSRVACRWVSLATRRPCR